MFENNYKIRSDPDIKTITSNITNYKSSSDNSGKNIWILINWQIWSLLTGTTNGVVILIINKNTYG